MCPFSASTAMWRRQIAYPSRPHTPRAPRPPFENVATEGEGGWGLEEINNFHISFRPSLSSGYQQVAEKEDGDSVLFFSFFGTSFFVCCIVLREQARADGPAGGQSIREQWRSLHIVIYERGEGEWKVANLCEHFSLHDKVRRGGGGIGTAKKEGEQRYKSF